MTGVIRRGAVPELTNAFGFPIVATVATIKAFTGTAATGLLLEASRMYVLDCTEDCYVKFGTADTVAATTSSFHIALFRGVPKVIVTPDTAVYFSVVQATAAGNLILQPMTTY